MDRPGMSSQPSPRHRPQSPGVNVLMIACQQGLETEVKSIIFKKPELVAQRDKTGKSALHYCAENTGLACATVLLSVNSELVNAQDDEGYSTLHLAVISGNKKIVRFLIAHGADANCADAEKHSCVHWATVCGELDCLDLLLSGGANPSSADIHGAFPIHYAAQMCGPNSEMGIDVRVGLAVLRLLLERGVDVDCRDQDGRQPLLWAASTETRASKTYCPSGSGDAILSLVNAGASVCSVDKDGLTALHCAASRGHVECLDTLINLCGAEVDFMDNNGCTSLFYSVTLGHADCTNLLLKYGANPNRQDRKGRTPAHCGSAKGQLETIKIISQYGGNLWMRNVRGDLPLHEAVQSGRRDLVRWLLDQLPAAVNAGNSNGRTAIHVAAINNNIEMCKILMDMGANINPLMRNSKGQLLSPMDATLQRGNQGCAKYLQLHGALPATKLLEKQGNRMLLNQLESKSRMPAPEMRVLPNFDDGLRDDTVYANHAVQTDKEQRDRQIQLSQSDLLKYQESQQPERRTRIVNAEVHYREDAIEVTLLKEAIGSREISYKTSGVDAQVQATDNEDELNSKDRSTSTEVDYQTGNNGTVRILRPSRLHRSQQTSIERLVDPLSDNDDRNAQSRRARARRRVEFERAKGAASDSEAEIRINHRTEQFEYDAGDYVIVSTLQGRRARSENALRRKQGRDIQRERAASEPRSKVNIVRLMNEAESSQNNSRDHILTIEVNNQDHPQLPDIQRVKNHSFVSSGADTSIISPNSSLRSTESNATTQKDSGFSDYVEGLHSAHHGDASSEASSEVGHFGSAIAGHWNETGQTAIGDYGRRRRARRKPAMPGEEMAYEEDEHKIEEDNIVADYKNAGPRVTERLQREKLNAVNLNNVKPKVDSGQFSRYNSGVSGRSSTTVPQSRTKIIKIVRPLSETQKYTNPDTIAQEVQQSLRKYELERKLFQELQDLKRQQIRSGRANEAFLVKRMVDKYRKDIMYPGMRDFSTAFTYKNFERYLYDQLRQLSSSNQGKVPKLKSAEEPPLRSKLVREGILSPTQCVVRTYKCHHATEAYAGYPEQQVFQNTNFTKLPAIPLPSNQSKLSPPHQQTDKLAKLSQFPSNPESKTTMAQAVALPLQSNSTSSISGRATLGVNQNGLILPIAKPTRLNKLHQSKDLSPVEALPANSIAGAKSGNDKPKTKDFVFNNKIQEVPIQEVKKNKTDKLKTGKLNALKNGWNSNVKSKPIGFPVRSQISKIKGPKDGPYVKRGSNDSSDAGIASDLETAECELVLNDLLDTICDVEEHSANIIEMPKSDTEEDADSRTILKTKTPPKNVYPILPGVNDLGKAKSLNRRNNPSEVSLITDKSSLENAALKSKLPGRYGGRIIKSKLNLADFGHKSNDEVVAGKNSKYHSTKTVKSPIISTDNSPEIEECLEIPDPETKSSESTLSVIKSPKKTTVTSPKRGSITKSTIPIPVRKERLTHRDVSPKVNSFRHQKPITNPDVIKIDPLVFIHEAQKTKKSPIRRYAPLEDTSAETIGREAGELTPQIPAKIAQAEEVTHQSPAKTIQAEELAHQSPAEITEAEQLTLQNPPRSALVEDNTELTESKSDNTTETIIEYSKGSETMVVEIKEVQNATEAADSELTEPDLKPAISPTEPTNTSPTESPSKTYLLSPIKSKSIEVEELLNPNDENNNNNNGSTVPMIVLEAVRDKLDSTTEPTDLVMLEMSSDGNSTRKLSKTLTVQELLEVTQRIQKNMDLKSPNHSPSKQKSKNNTNEPLTFEIKHGKERNVFKLPSDKLKGSKKWQVTFIVGRRRDSIVKPVKATT